MFKTICWTIEEFRYRWNNYKNNGRKYQEYGTCMQQHLSEHFSEEGHHGFLEYVSITLIDKTDPSNALQRENYWRCILKTMAPWVLNFEDCLWNSVLLYSYHWICTDCNKDLIYRNDFGTLFSSLSLLLPFLWLCCFYCCFLHDCVGVLLAIIIGVGLIVATIVVIFVALLLLLHHCFVLFNMYCAPSCFHYYHCYFCVIVVSNVLLLLFFHCPCSCHYYCISFFVITITTAAWVLLWSLL